MHGRSGRVERARRRAHPLHLGGRRARRRHLRHGGARGRRGGVRVGRDGRGHGRLLERRGLDAGPEPDAERVHAVVPVAVRAVVADAAGRGRRGDERHRGRRVVVLGRDGLSAKEPEAFSSSANGRLVVELVQERLQKKKKPSPHFSSTTIFENVAVIHDSNNMRSCNHTQVSCFGLWMQRWSTSLVYPFFDSFEPKLYFIFTVQYWWN